jgi:hypothetical protein
MNKHNKMQYCITITIIFLFFALPNSVLSNSEENKEAFYDQLTRAVVRIEEHQSICTPGLDWSYERDVPVGTGFFLHDKHKGDSKYYIVTARHVVEKRADLFARVRISGDSNKYVVLLLPRRLWVFNPSTEKKGYLPVDVAVMQIQPTNFIKTFLLCENDESCGKDSNNKQLKNQLNESPNVMDRAIFFGFPGGDVAKESLEPFARAGVVAYTAFNPDFRIDGKLVPDDSIYYIDSPSFPGNSGGPVLREPLPLRGGVKLFGLITGGNLVGRDYAIATRPEKILETIKHARKVARKNINGWQEDLPKLPIKCTPDEKEKKEQETP